MWPVLIGQLAGLADTVLKKFVKDWDQSKLDKLYELQRDLQAAEANDPPDMNYLDYKRQEFITYVKTYSDAIRAAIADKQ